MHYATQGGRLNNALNKETNQFKVYILKITVSTESETN